MKQTFKHALWRIWLVRSSKSTFPLDCFEKSHCWRGAGAYVLTRDLARMPNRFLGTGNKYLQIINIYSHMTLTSNCFIDLMIW